MAFEEERQAAGFQNKLRRIVRLSRAEDEAQRVIWCSGSGKPENWNQEVVRALGTRMPGGLASVTLQCKFCNSIFYPCLCEKGVREIPHTRILVAPRVVREAEVRRLHSKPMGHLGELATSLDICGMEKDKLIVVGPATGEEDKQDRLPIPTGTISQVKWREDQTYVLEKKMEGTKQLITFRKRGGEEEDVDELRKLEGLLVDRDGDLMVRERWQGHYVKPEWVQYSTMDEAVRDLRLVKVRTNWQSFWEVAYVRPQGLAAAAGMQEGQRLIDAFLSQVDERAVKSKIRQKVKQGDRWLDPENGQGIPECFLDPDFFPELCPQDEALFPCFLVFDLVTPGSVVKGAAPLSDYKKEDTLPELKTSDQLAILLAHEGDTVVQFERVPRARVSRSEAAVRHKHYTEGKAYNKSVGEELEATMEPSQIRAAREETNQERDEKLFDIWLASKNMTPSHLKYVCHKLVASVRAELSNFKRKEKGRLEMLLSKSLNCTQMQKELDRCDKPKEVAMKEREIQVCKKELAILFDQVPLSFLESIDKMKVKAERDTLTPRGTKASEETGPLAQGQKGATMSSTKPAAGTARARRSMRAAQLLHVACWRDATREFGECLGSLPDIERDWLKDAIFFLANEVNLYRENLHGRGAQKSLSQRSSTQKVQLPEMVYHSSEDGRLTLKEFQKQMLMSGVNWLDEEEMRELFDSLDNDKSGKLSLGELLSTAMQLSDLAERLQHFVNENKDMSTENCLLEFRALLRMGSDLIGTRNKPQIPDRNITFSSVFMRKPYHGEGEQFRCRLDSTESCWMADETDKQPWIEWEFHSCREIWAIATTGRPDDRCWVTEYQVWYTDLDHDAFVRSEGAMRGEASFWHPVAPSDPSDNGHFRGNEDQNSRKDNELQVPIVATRVRLYPVAWHGRRPALRAALYGTFRPGSQKLEGDPPETAGGSV